MSHDRRPLGSLTSTGGGLPGGCRGPLGDLRLLQLDRLHFAGPAAMGMIPGRQRRFTGKKSGPLAGRVPDFSGAEPNTTPWTMVPTDVRLLSQYSAQVPISWPITVSTKNPEGSTPSLFFPLNFVGCCLWNLKNIAIRHPQTLPGCPEQVPLRAI